MKVIKFAPGLVPVIKHEQHDQSTHGSWAEGSDAPASQDDYKMGHRPGDIESGASLDNVSGNDIYPEDVYSPNGLRNYSTGYPELDKEAHALIMRAKGNPEMTVTIYRAVPNDASITEIKDGDWVTPTKGYAEIHGESNLNDDYKIISAEVKAKDIYTSGDSWHEWGYSKSSSVEKHGEHDQSSHGNWADGVEGGNGLTHRDVYRLQSGMQDTLMRKIYDAEEKYQPNVQREIPKPFPPSREKYLSGEMTKEQYDKGWKEYSKKFDEWSRESTRNIKSSAGEKNLDGSKAGVQKYVDDVTSADWFIERFGRGGVIGTPKVSLGTLSVAGKYEIGTKNGVGYSRLSIDKGYSQAEPVILHELAHYATAISANKPYAGHGLEFARNYIYMAGKVMGPEYASGLESSFKEKGVPIG